LAGNEQGAQLIGRVASNGDHEAFKALFDYFAPRIKGFLVKTGSRSEEADEIAQRTRIAVWQSASQFDSATTGAAAWIFPSLVIFESTRRGGACGKDGCIRAGARELQRGADGIYGARPQKRGAQSLLLAGHRATAGNAKG
jgi:hypothetical protein